MLAAWKEIYDREILEKYIDLEKIMLNGQGEEGSKGHVI